MSVLQLHAHEPGGNACRTTTLRPSPQTSGVRVCGARVCLLLVHSCAANSTFALAASEGYTSLPPAVPCLLGSPAFLLVAGVTNLGAAAGQDRYWQAQRRKTQVKRVSSRYRYDVAIDGAKFSVSSVHAHAAILNTASIIAATRAASGAYSLKAGHPCAELVERPEGCGLHGDRGVILILGTASATSAIVRPTGLASWTSATSARTSPSTRCAAQCLGWTLHALLVPGWITGLHSVHSGGWMHSSSVLLCCCFVAASKLY